MSYRTLSEARLFELNPHSTTTGRSVAVVSVGDVEIHSECELFSSIVLPDVVSQLNC